MVNSLHRVNKRRPIPGLEELVKIAANVVAGMSTDQSLFYQLGLGSNSPELGAKKCRAQVHSRWVTTAEAFLFLWFSDHGLEGELLQRLEIIVTFIVQVYHHIYFKIKVILRLISNYFSNHC